MTTVLQYLVIAAVIGLVLFGIALVLFGRGEQMAPLPARTSPANLPSEGIRGDDVRSVKFSLAVRGYRMSDVDWTLDRLADELDRTRKRLAELDPVMSSSSSPAHGPDVADVPEADASMAVHQNFDETTGAAEVVAPAGFQSHPAQSHPAQSHPAQSHPAQTHTAQSEPEQHETAHHEPAQHEPAQHEPAQHGGQSHAGDDLFVNDPEIGGPDGSGHRR